MHRTRIAEEDLRRSLRLVRPLLRIVGAWPRPLASPTSSKLLDRSLIFLSYFVQFLVLFPSFLYVFVKEKNSRRQMKMLMPHINGFGQLCKYSILLYRMNEFRTTLEDIRDDWLNAKEENRLILRTNAKIGHKVVLIVAMTLYSGGLCYRTILPLSKGKIVLPDNTTIRLLPCPSYFVLFNEQITPYYEIIFALQVLGGFLTYTILCGTLGIFAFFSLHMCSLLNILVNKMLELTNQTDTSERAVQDKIARIIEYQTKIKRFLAKIEQITPYLCFIEIVNQTGMACVLGYCIIMEWEDSNATAILIYLLIQITSISITFTTCYVGQLLIDASNNVRRTATTLNWYRFPTKKARYLVLMIIMSNRPTKLTAGKVVDVSLATFTDIMKASMGYLNVLRGVV
ncbi:odorant receptor 43a-like [Xylocopa sonorina]|uniref:odorant receptor 43a-like n=1 Tax=Xylocopa sonorina TaxID=1818115 RepID=UPI00403B14C1